MIPRCHSWVSTAGSLRLDLSAPRKRRPGRLDGGRPARQVEELIEARALRPLGHKLLDVLVEGAVAALPDHLGHGAGGSVPHRDELGLEPAVDDRTPVTPGTGAPADVGQRGLDIGPRERRGEGRALQPQLDVTVNACIVQPALSMEGTTTLAPTR